MRISDWSSDVCSSDLWPRARPRAVRRAPRLQSRSWRSSNRAWRLSFAVIGVVGKDAGRTPQLLGEHRAREQMRPGRAAEREQQVGPRPLGIVETVGGADQERSEEHTSELQSLMRISYAVFCLKKKKKTHTQNKI